MRLIAKKKKNMFYDSIIWYDHSKFEFECPFSDYVIFLDIQNFCYYARNHLFATYKLIKRPLTSKRDGEIS